jgi:hypothetical protein
MTQKEFEERLLRAVEKAERLIQSQAPVRSGELKNSIMLLATATGYEIVVKAPHMPFTEEVWISDQWRGRKNPNEGWFKEAVELAFRLIRAELGASGYNQGNRSDNNG